MKKVTQAIIKKIKKVAPKKAVAPKKPSVSYAETFKCLNCEDSGMDCYICKAA